MIASVRGIAAFGVLALGIIACQSGLPAPTFVDGWPIGETVACGVRDCGPFFDFAVADLDTSEPDHAPIVAIEAYVPDFRTWDGQRLLLTRSGGSDLIIVLRLEDGSVRAAFVGCGVGVEPFRCFMGERP